MKRMSKQTDAEGQSLEHARELARTNGWRAYEVLPSWIMEKEKAELLPNDLVKYIYVPNLPEGINALRYRDQEGVLVIVIQRVPSRSTLPAGFENVWTKYGVYDGNNMPGNFNIPDSWTEYGVYDVNVESFKREYKNEYDYINDILNRHGVNRDDPSTITSEQLKFVFNELVNKDNFVLLLGDKIKNEFADQLRQYHESMRNEDSTGYKDIREMNKRVLHQIIPLTLDINPIINERIFHEIHEEYWEQYLTKERLEQKGLENKEKLSIDNINEIQHNAHILASAQGLLAFGDKRNKFVPAEYWYQLNSMLPGQLAGIIRETAEQRTKHHSIIERYLGTEALGTVLAREDKIRETADKIEVRNSLKPYGLMISLVAWVVGLYTSWSIGNLFNGMGGPGVQGIFIAALMLSSVIIGGYIAYWLAKNLVRSFVIRFVIRRHSKDLVAI